MTKLINLFFWGYLLFQVLEGLFKYVLGISGLIYFSYLPKVLLIMVIMLKLYHATIDWKSRVDNILLLGLIFMGLITGILFVRDTGQVSFGLYALLPFFFGYSASSYILFKQSNNLFYYKILFFLALSGVIADFFFVMPWEGYSYESFGRENEGSRSWNQFEIQRPAGFSSISWSASSHIAIFGLLIAYNSKRLIIKAFYALLIVFGILITTTKGVLIALFGIIFLLSFPQKFWRLGFRIVVIFSIILPISVLFYQYELPKLNSLFGFLTYSFFLRLTDAWPRFYQLLDSTVMFLTGKGFGAFGQASFRVLTSESHAVDSFFLYMFGILGIPGIIFIYSKMIKVASWLICIKQKVYFAILVAFVIYGIIVSGIEFGLWGLFFGLILGIKKSDLIHEQEGNENIS